MQSVTVSAPGKLMLFGEHAILHGQPCIVTAVGQRLFVTASKCDDSFFSLDAPQVGVHNLRLPLERLGEGDMPSGARFVAQAFRCFHARFPFSGGVHFSVRSEFASTCGFGSSSASATATLCALFALMHTPYSPDELFALSYRTVLDVQGKASGFDVAAATYGGTFSYTVAQGRCRILPPLPLVVGYSGTKADTISLISHVDTRVALYGLDNLYPAIGALVSLALDCFDDENLSQEKLGDLMNINQAYLEALGTSTSRLSAMILAARGAGAFGAKLSGAGGGDCMIALVSPQRRHAVTSAIAAAGGQIIDIPTGVDGVRIEV